MALPDTISGLSLWLRADSISQSNNTAVATWPDSGPSGFDATQATSTKRPTYRTAQINGLPAVRFDGGDGLASNASASHPETTMFVLVRPESITGDRTFRTGSGSGALSYRFRDNAPNLGSKDIVEIGGAATNGTNNAWNLLSVSFSDSGNIVRFYKAGATDGTVTTSVSLTAGRTTTIGEEVGQSRFFLGDMAELIVYSRILTTGERASVHTYLSDKYAITVSDYAGISVPLTGIASAEAWGTPSLRLGPIIGGIASAEAWGTPTFTAGAVSRGLTGIASAEAWGTPEFKASMGLVGIPSAEAFGTLSLRLTVSLPGIPSAEAWGSTFAQYLQTVTTTSIASGEAWGKPSMIVTIDTSVRGLVPRTQYTPNYELLVYGRLPRQSGPPTILLVDAVDWKSLVWGSTLSKPQTLSATCRISDVSEAVRQRLRAPDLLPSELVLQRNGKTVFAGPLLTGSEGSDEITLQAGGLLTYLQWMYVISDLAYKQIDQFQIVAALVDHWQTLEYANFGINTADVGTSGVLRDAIFDRKEIHQISRRIEEMGEAAMGFDLEVDPFTRDLQLWHPGKGIDRSSGPDAVVFDGRSIEGLGGMFSVTPADMASDAFGSGTASGLDKTFWSEQSDTDLRAFFGRTGIANGYSETPTQEALDDLVKGLRDSRNTPLRAPGKQVRVTPDTDLNSYDVGDVISYQLSGILGIGGAYRIRARQVSVDQSGQESVTLEFV